jgi:hypothetical protein
MDKKNKKQAGIKDVISETEVQLEMMGYEKFLQEEQQKQRS